MEDTTMTKKILTLLLTAAVFTACSEMHDDISAVQQQPDAPALKGVVMQVADIPYAETAVAGATRSTMAVDATGLTFTWSAGDKTGVYSSADGFALFNLTAGAGTSSATFDGGGFTLTDGATYYSFFPYASAATDKAAVPVDFTGQTLTQDDDMVSPMTKDYLYASAVADAGNAQFNYSHLGSFVRTKLTMPASTSVESVDFIPMYAELTQQGTVDVTAALNPLTATVTSPKLSLTLSGVDVPSGGELTLWGAMAPQDLSATTEAVAIVAHSGSDIYSARVAGKNLQAGKAYRWAATPILPTGYSHGLTVSTKAQKNYGTGLGQYSAITWLGDNHYAVVHDKENGGGIVLFDFDIADDGTIGEVTRTTPAGTSGSAITDMDNEGIAYFNGKLYVSAEADQSVREYTTDGTATGNSFTIPADMAVGKITANAGFEALTYNATTHLFWTTTETALPKDSYLPRLHRLQSFGEDMQPAQRYLYQMDAPQYSSEGATQYVYGISAMAALDDGRLVVLEREIYTNTSTYTAHGVAKLYVVDPVHDTAGILRKSLLTTITTGLLDLANYEGMCLGPTLSDGSRCLVLIGDSQGTAYEMLQVVTIK